MTSEIEKIQKIREQLEKIANTSPLEYFNNMKCLTEMAVLTSKHTGVSGYVRFPVMISEYGEALKQPAIGHSQTTSKNDKTMFFITVDGYKIIKSKLSTASDEDIEKLKPILIKLIEQNREIIIKHWFQDREDDSESIEDLTKSLIKV